MGIKSEEYRKPVFKRRSVLSATVYLFVAGYLMAILTSCSTRSMVIDEFTDIVETGAMVIEKDDDLEMLSLAIPANIKLLEILLANDPTNYRLRTLLSKLYGTYGFVFKEHELEKAVLLGKDQIKGECHPGDGMVVMKQQLAGYYARGAEYALEALEQKHPGCHAKLKNVRLRDAFLDTLNLKDLPALFWYGFNMGAFINHNRGSVRAISKAGLVEKIMQKVIELDPAYFHFTAHLVLMVYYQNFPPITSGNQKMAHFHYLALKEKAGDDFLLGKCYYARYMLFKKQNRDGFAAVLKEIIHYSNEHDRYPLLNQTARVKAKTYLDSIDRFFE